MNGSQFSLAQNLAQSDEDRITYFAVTDTRNKRTPFGIKREDRSRHSYIIGKTGMGKSTLLENMAVQDIQNGEGLCFIDPHGGTAEKLLEYVPEERVKDLLYFAPFDMQYPVSFNVLENVDADKRHLVVAGLMSTFEKIWVDAWSARMAYILQNTLAALLEFPGATLLGVNRMYIDKEYRKNVIARITDPAVRSFWVDEYSKYTDRYAQEATPAIQNKIGQFASNALVRNVIGQEESAFNIRDLMDQKKIFIVNLSKGRVGEGNANLLGSMLITKIYLAAMSRADVSSGNMRALPPFYLYVDEFQNFANKSFADILSEARKYKLALTIAHQYIEQMEEEVASAVFGNVGTMMTFRVGAYDAEVLEKEFAPTFTAEDLVNLGARQIYLKLMIDGVSSQPFSAVTMPPIAEPEVSHRDRAVAFSRAQFSRPREEVEKSISDWVGKKYEDPEAPAKEVARLERKAERESEASRQTSSSGSGTAQRPPYVRSGAVSRPAPSLSSPSRPPSGADRPRPPMPRTSRPESIDPLPRQATPPPRTYERNAPPQEEYVRHDDAPHQDVRTYVAPHSDVPPRTESTPRPQSSREGGIRRQFSPPRPLPPEKKQESIADLRSVLARMAPTPSPQATPDIPAQTNDAVFHDTNISGPIPHTAPAPSLVPSNAPQPFAQKRPFQPRDDGKSVTEAGKQELRTLLASLKSASGEKPQQSQPPTPLPRDSVVSTSTPKMRVETQKPSRDTRPTTPMTAVVAPRKSENPRPETPGLERVENPHHIPVARVTGQTQKPVVETHTPQPHERAHEEVQNASEIPPVDLRRMLHVDKPDIT
jgi:hypothetical protein